MIVLGVERIAGLKVTGKGSQGMARMAVGRLGVRELVLGSTLLEEPKLGTAEQELQCWEGGLVCGGEGRREYSLLLVCHGNREKALESRAHTAAEEVFR